MSRLRILFISIIWGVASTYAPLLGQATFEKAAHRLTDPGTTYGEIRSVGLGPGISFFDFDNDGWDDITLPASANRDFQFLKNEEGSFRKVDLSISSNGLQSRQAIWVDFDNDGDNDFFATSDEGRCWFYRNDGAMQFTDILEQSGITKDNLSYWGASWGDYDNDGFLDLFISIRDPQLVVPNILYRNKGDGTFENVTVQSGLSTTGHLTFCATFFDYNGDGLLDIYMANDKDAISNILYKNLGNGRFEDTGMVSASNLYMSAMSTTIEDYDNDGDLDIYVTNFYPPFLEGAVIGNAFLENQGDGTFQNKAQENGTRFDSIGWGAIFFDAENDGDTDLFVSGSLEGSGERISSAFYENDGRKDFESTNQEVFNNDGSISFGNAIGDFDNNGFADIVVVNTENQPLNLWENRSDTLNNWLKVKLQGTESNRMGIGSWITVYAGGKIQRRYTICGEGYAGQNSAAEFFGLANAADIDYIEVKWLSGIVDRIEDIGANQEMLIVEGTHRIAPPDEPEESSEEDQDEDEVSSDEAEGQVEESLGSFVYPNPTNGILKLNGLKNVEKITIFNSVGSHIMTVTDKNQIELHQQPEGLYYINVMTDDGPVSFKFLVKK